MSESEKNAQSELETMKRKLAEMEEEAMKLRKLQTTADVQEDSSPSEKDSSDSRSVYIGNVDYGASPEELQRHFESCGSIERVTILCDKYTGHPKGFAYIEFKEEESVQAAIALSESVLHGRLIKVLPKRTNVPFYALSQRGYKGGFPRGGGYPPPPIPYYYPQPYFYPQRGSRGGHSGSRGSSRYPRGSYRGPSHTRRAPPQSSSGEESASNKN